MHIDGLVRIFHFYIISYSFCLLPGSTCVATCVCLNAKSSKFVTLAHYFLARIDDRLFHTVIILRVSALHMGFCALMFLLSMTWCNSYLFLFYITRIMFGLFLDWFTFLWWRHILYWCRVSPDICGLCCVAIYKFIYFGTLVQSHIPLSRSFVLLQLLSEILCTSTCYGTDTQN